MLKRQNGGGHQHGHLLAIINRLKSRANGHFGFSEANVATDQTVHGAFSLHVFFYVFGGRALVRRVLINKRGFQFGLQITVWIKGEALLQPPFGIKLD